MNVLCTIGAMIGLASIFLSWTWWSSVPTSDYLTSASLATMLMDIPSHLDNLMFVGGTVFAAGALVAFISPTGGLIQAFGLVLFYADEIDRQANVERFGFDRGVGLGFFIACLSTLLVITSLVRPSGIGHGGRIVAWSERIWTMSGHLDRPYWAALLRGVRRNEAWVIALTVTGLLAATVVVVENEPFDKGPLVEIDGGVMWVVDSATHVTWTDGSVSLGDGSETVVWDTDCDSLGMGVWATNVYETKNLSGVNLTLTIIDSTGNGQIGSGDALVLTAGEGTSFTEGVQYRLSIYMEINYFPSPPPLHCHVDFEFQDGELLSNVTIEM